MATLISERTHAILFQLEIRYRLNEQRIRGTKNWMHLIRIRLNYDGYSSPVSQRHPISNSNGIFESNLLDLSDESNQRMMRFIRLDKKLRYDYPNITREYLEILILLEKKLGAKYFNDDEGTYIDDSVGAKKIRAYIFNMSNELDMTLTYFLQWIEEVMSNSEKYDEKSLKVDLIELGNIIDDIV